MVAGDLMDALAGARNEGDTGTAGELGHFLGGSAQVVGGHSWKAIGAGRQWTCGVTTDGALYCWGNTTTGRTMEPVQVVP